MPSRVARNRGNYGTKSTVNTKTVSKKPVPKKKTVKKKVVTKKKVKIKWKNIFMALGLLLVFFLMMYFLLKIPISNIYISGNSLLTDQGVIEIADVSSYPSILEVVLNTEKVLEKDPLIKDAKVSLHFRKLYIDVTENYPLFYDTDKGKTILYDKKEVTESYNVPVLLNYVPDTIYDSFIKGMQRVDLDIIERISEIKYDPDEVDDGRFLLSMRDGNYVYLTVAKWKNINNYVSIIKEFPNQKGILYLNAGNSFEIHE